MPGPRLLPAINISDAVEGDSPPWLITISGDMAVGIERRSSVARWQSLGVPVLAENWHVGMGSGASMLLGDISLPASLG